MHFIATIKSADIMNININYSIISRLLYTVPKIDSFENRVVHIVSILLCNLVN